MGTHYQFNRNIHLVFDRPAIRGNTLNFYTKRRADAWMSIHLRDEERINIFRNLAGGRFTKFRTAKKYPFKITKPFSKTIDPFPDINFTKRWSFEIIKGRYNDKIYNEFNYYFESQDDALLFKMST